MSRQQKRLEERKTIKALAKIGNKIYDGINKLYWLKVVEKETKKIGDTTRDVEERNDETITNAALHIEEQKWWIAKYSSTHHNKGLAGKPFRDYDFHKFLEIKGYKRELNNNNNKSEWFFDISFEQFEKELKEFIGGKPKLALILRNGQEYLFNKTIEGWDNGIDLTNVYASVRIGKNIYSLHTSKIKGYVPIYIGKNLTSQSSVEKDNDDYGIVPVMRTFSIHGILESDDKSSVKIQKIIDEIEQITPDKKVHFNVDEVDDQSHTKKSREILVQIINHFRNKSEYSVKVTCMSGTRAHRGLKLLNDLKRPDENINEINISYNEMQLLQPNTTVKRNFLGITIYSENEIELTNISDSMKSSKGRKDLCKSICTLVGDNNYDLKDTTNHPHWFIKFCTVGKKKANSLVNLLNKHHSVVDGQEYYYQNVNGKFTTNRSAELYCKGIIKDHDGKIVVFITQGMATTSFSVEDIGNTVIFTDNELTSDDLQSGHRSATHDNDKEWCNIILVTTNNSKEMKFDDIFEEEVVGCGRKEKVTILREILETNSITYVLQDGYECDLTSPLKVNVSNVEQIISQKEKEMSTRSSIVQLLFEDDDIDFEQLQNMLDGKSSNTSRKSNTKKGGTSYPFGKPDKKIKKSLNEFGLTKKQNILREFTDKLINVPSVSKLMGLEIESFDEWNLIGMDMEIFFHHYNTNPILRDRLDTIYTLCEDENYLVNKHINNLTL
jgi:hypothetical protein